MKGDGVFESPVAAHALDTMTREERRENAEWLSTKAGLQVFGMVSAVTVPSTLALVKYNKFFATRTGVSGRVATAFLPALFGGVFVAEQTASRLANPQAYERREATRVPMIRRVRNLVENEPVKLIAMVGVPVVGSIFYLNNQMTHLTLSQKVMHTRVYGQFSILSLLCIMGGYRYLAHEDREREQAQATA